MKRVYLLVKLLALTLAPGMCLSASAQATQTAPAARPEQQQPVAGERNRFTLSVKITRAAASASLPAK